MPRILLPLLALALLPLSASTAQQLKKDRKLLRNADIVRMAQNQFDDETLLKIIQVSDTDFDISGDALIELKKQGVSPAVIRAMLEAAAQRKLSADTDSNVSAPVPPTGSDSPVAEPPPSPVVDKPAATDQHATASAGSATANVDPNSAATPVALQPATMAAPAGMPPGMAVNPQMAMLQSQLAMMGLGGMAGMFGGGAPANYTPEQLPHVFLMDAQVRHEKHEYPPSMAEIAQTKFKSGAPSPGGMALRSLATEALSFASMSGGPAGMMAMSAFSAASGFMPGMRPGTPSMTYVWGLPGRKSARQLTYSDPIFQLSYGDIPGVDPDAFAPVILRLVQTPDNYRLVGATRTKLNARNMMAGGGPENGKWLAEDRWPTRVYKEERGFYVVRVDKPLEPGEYAVVLRPVKGYKASPSGLGGHAQVFYSVWDFSVPGVVPEPAKKK